MKKLRFYHIVSALMFLIMTAVIVPGCSDGQDFSSEGCTVPAQLDTDMTNANQADIISLSGINPINCPEVEMVETWGGGKLIFSDSPEYPDQAGKLYEDDGLAATSGTDYNRIFVYHVNGKRGGGNKSRMKLTVLVKNLGSEDATLTVQKSGTAGPTQAYLYAGKLGFYRWLTSTAESPRTLSPGETVRLDTSFDANSFAKNYLKHGIWDYSMTQPHQVTVCALDHNDNPLNDCPGLSVLPRDTHDRGTFEYTEKVYDTASTYQIDTANGIVQYPIAWDSANDTDVQGVDETDGTPMELDGNFGILYRMHLNTKSTDGRKLGLLLNPRGGTWGGAIWTVAGEEPGGKFLLPPSTGSLGDNTKGVVWGKWDVGSSFTIWAQFMPTGGSAFPLRAVVVPY